MPEPRQDAGQPAGGNQTPTPQALYSRRMPGGGFVRVELLVVEPGAVAAERARGRVVMERRAQTPATPEEPPVIVEELEGDDATSVVDELFRIAQDNAAIARRVLRQRAAP